MVDYADRLRKLNKIYEAFPETTCKVSCGDWCCSKLEELFDENGNYMSLPMIYSIEYLNILNHLKKKYTQEQIDSFADFNNKKPMCCFRDSANNACRIHTVHPFSCRVYGHRVPPIFWGVTATQEMADNIFCPNMKVLDEEKAKAFRESYPSFWEELASLSSGFSLFSEKKQEVMMRVAGIPDIKVLGWLEFHYLVRLSDEEFGEKFEEFWKTYSNLM